MPESEDSVPGEPKRSSPPGSKEDSRSVEIGMWLACAVMTVTRRGDCAAVTLGGAISNMYAMLIARFKMFPEVKEKGMAAVPRLIAFTSEHVRVLVLSKFKIMFRKAEVEGMIFGNALSPEVLFPKETPWKRMARTAE